MVIAFLHWDSSSLGAHSAHLSLCNFHRSQQRQAAATAIQEVPDHAGQICGDRELQHQIASRNRLFVANVLLQ